MKIPRYSWEPDIVSGWTFRYSSDFQQSEECQIKTGDYRAERSRIPGMVPASDTASENFPGLVRRRGRSTISDYAMRKILLANRVTYGDKSKFFQT